MKAQGNLRQSQSLIVLPPWMLLKLSCGSLSAGYGLPDLPSGFGTIWPARSVRAHTEVVLDIICSSSGGITFISDKGFSLPLRTRKRFL
jgi:hypothetical protein